MHFKNMMLESYEHLQIVDESYPGFIAVGYIQVEGEIPGSGRNWVQ